MTNQQTLNVAADRVSSWEHLYALFQREALRVGDEAKINPDANRFLALWENVAATAGPAGTTPHGNWTNRLQHAATVQMLSAFLASPEAEVLNGDYPVSKETKAAMSRLPLYPPTPLDQALRDYSSAMGIRKHGVAIASV